MLPMFRAAAVRASGAAAAVARTRAQSPCVLRAPAATTSRWLQTTPVPRAGAVQNNHVDTEDNNLDTPFEFTEKSMAEVEELLSKYPANYKQSAIIPMLWIAQKQNDGWLPLSAMNKCAVICEMSPILVYEVATFYTMFNRKKIGKYNLQMCTTTPCMVLGAYDVLDTIQEKLDVKIGGDTKDMMFHLMEVECLGACANAPMMQVSHSGGDEYYEDLTPDNVLPILEAYQADTPPPPGPQHGGPEFPAANGVRAGPQPNGPQGHPGQRRGCEGPMGKTTLFEEPYGPSCRKLEKSAPE